MFWYFLREGIMKKANQIATRFEYKNYLNFKRKPANKKRTELF